MNFPKIFKKINSPVGIIFSLLYLVLLTHSLLFIGLSCGDFDFSCMTTGFLIIGTPFFIPILYLLGLFFEKLITKNKLFIKIIAKFKKELPHPSLLLNFFLIELLVFYTASFIWLGINGAKRCGHEILSDCLYFDSFHVILRSINFQPNTWVIDIISIAIIPAAICLLSLFLILFKSYKKIRYIIMPLNILGLLLITQIILLPTHDIAKNVYFLVNPGKKHDEQLVRIIENVQRTVKCHFFENGELPVSKIDIQDNIKKEYQNYLTSKKYNFEYIKNNEFNFDICGNFITSSNIIKRNYQYQKGRTCFNEEISSDNLLSSACFNANNNVEYESIVISNYIANKLEKFYLANGSYEGFKNNEENLKAINGFINKYIDKYTEPDYKVYTLPNNYIIKIKDNTKSFNEYKAKVYCLDKKAFNNNEPIKRDRNVENFYSNTNCKN